MRRFVNLVNVCNLGHLPHLLTTSDEADAKWILTEEYEKKTG